MKLFKNIKIILFVLNTLYRPTSVTGLSSKLVPILIKADVETDQNYMLANVTINRYGSVQNFSMDLDMMITKPVSNVKINTGYFVRLRDSENWIYNRTFDFCEFLLRPSIDRISSLVYSELRRHGRVPARCPIPKGRYLFTNNTLQSIRLPSYLPETSFGFTVNIFFTKNLVEGFKLDFVRLPDDTPIHTTKDLRDFFKYHNIDLADRNGGLVHDAFIPKKSNKKP